MRYPAGLHVDEHPPAGGWAAPDAPVVVYVHGSLDRGSSFARVIRRLPGWGAITYDRRGYHGSRDRPPHHSHRAAGSPADSPPGQPTFPTATTAPTATTSPTSPGDSGALGGHVRDLLGVVGALSDIPGGVTAIGHSLGGDVVVGAALAAPRLFASIGVFEPPMPWLGFRRALQPVPSQRARTDGNAGGAQAARHWPPFDSDPAVEAERFFHRMVGKSAWERLPESAKQDRRDDGPALVADLTSIRGSAPFDVTALTVPTLFGRSGAAGEAHHRETAAWLVEHVPGAELMEIDGAGHGAHLSHPDAFAGFVRHAVEMGARARRVPGTHRDADQAGALG
ncbi:MAG: alpha/beta fold hydrolase [Acidimicrobiales bacterium]